jgi:hypothetical protein
MGHQTPFPSSYHQNALTRHIEHSVITRSGQILFPTGAEPVSVKDSFLFLLENLVGEVIVAMKGTFHH